MKYFRVKVQIGSRDQSLVVQVKEDQLVPQAPKHTAERLTFFQELLGEQHDLFVERPGDIQEMIRVFDDDELQKYLCTYYGNGAWSARYWFAGIEPGLPPDPDPPEQPSLRRLQEIGITTVDCWRALGGGHFIDPVAFWRLYDPLNGLRSFLFDGQRTWDRLLKILLRATNGSNPSLTDIKRYRKACFLRDNQICSLDLFPLPLCKSNEWIYNDCSTLNFLRSKDTYRDEVLPTRISFLRDQIRYWTPKAVVFYGWEEREQFQLIAGVPFGERQFGEYDYLFGENADTKFLIIRHPPRYGSDEYFFALGNIISL